MISLSEENYLKAIFHLADKENTVTINEISKFLDVKMPSVNNMMKKFAEKNWVRYESYKPLKITDSGKPKIIPSPLSKGIFFFHHPPAAACCPEISF